MDEFIKRIYGRRTWRSHPDYSDKSQRELEDDFEEYPEHRVAFVGHKDERISIFHKKGKISCAAYVYISYARIS